MPVERTPVLADGGYVVVDDLLDPEAHQAAWRYFLTADFHRFNEKKLSRIWGLSGPEGFSSEIYRLQPSGAGVSGAPIVPAAVQNLCLRAIENPQCRAFLRDYPGWNQLGVQAFIYPVGTGVTWHLDGGDTGRLAALIYYAHPIWHTSWGGELLIGPASCAKPFRSIDSSDQSPFLRMSHPFDTRELLDSAIPHCVFPKPNRLVLIRSGVPHSIKRVDAAAGEAFRASISGFFFQKPLHRETDS